MGDCLVSTLQIRFQASRMSRRVDLIEGLFKIVAFNLTDYRGTFQELGMYARHFD